ncbi:Core-2/I-Branching enzyme [Rhodovulum sp. ES.010]|uniref:DUF5928 domain-containing protein n=1 Tax=Rhodovulum sp. ES.010 TaxID=1882821 RepID=UPI0009267AE9|nr:DUF5928 domain-containing protein [Rhodovulum sp. ES.010]SIO43022.1 Core-2/I-Branching enzyme [Rhodovulum sp. ES.010]
MAKIAYILLCHKAPEEVIRQAAQLTAAGDLVAIHFDARAPRAAYDRVRAALAGNPSVAFAQRRVRCGWGEWSLVAATLAALRAAEAAFPDATHFYMLSGDCRAIKSAEYVHAFLDAEDADYIESFDFFASDWIKTGLKAERLTYRHLFNERRRKRLFYGALALQRRLGLDRAIPADLQVMIGSQWWCLRRRTVEAVLDFIRARPDVVRFFRTTWIPDETFFQTLVRHLVPEDEITNRTPTFLMFSDYGMPVTFYNDHYDLLLGQDFLFARKISSEAHELKRRLGALYTASGVDFQISDEGRNLYSYLTGRGRVGRRFAPRIWEADSTLGPGRELMIVTCKKWHVGKRLLERIRQRTNLPALDYLFNEEDTALPDLGGIQTTLEKRMRHRRALLRMLFDHFGTDRMILCIDPGSFELMQDFHADPARTRLLDVQCRFSDDYLAGHARRVGLAGAHTPPGVLARVLPTIRHDIAFESDRIRDARFGDVYRIEEGRSPEDNAQPLSEFLSIPYDQAREIAATEFLFAD